jgi:hypothetical protein
MGNELTHDMENWKKVRAPSSVKVEAKICPPYLTLRSKNLSVREYAFASLSQ